MSHRRLPDATAAFSSHGRLRRRLLAGAVGWTALTWAGPALADCTDPPIPGVDYSDCSFDRGDLSGVNLSNARLRGATFLRADLSNANLSGAEAYNTKFISADVSESNFDNAKLYQSDFSRANAQGASFVGADLRAVEFYGANLRGADLTDAQLSKTSFTNADLSGATWTDGDYRLLGGLDWPLHVAPGTARRPGDRRRAYGRTLDRCTPVRIPVRQACTGGHTGPRDEDHRRRGNMRPGSTH
ncbi:MAG: pentapeptide repeat-containing protein [Rhodovibrio sp.]|nr:pentapeptide repeat-containing protein [Rhodovibrio sp.]